MKIKFCKETRDALLELKKTKRVNIEGNILKLIDVSEDPEMEKYVKESIKNQKDLQRKRLDITKQVQEQNKELIETKLEIERINEDLKEALVSSEESKQTALHDLDVLQKRTQFELVSVIVKISLAIIIGVGICTTLLYIFSMTTGKDTQLIGNTWSNMFGILLTNAFSIIGTIMGVKYASGNSGTKSNQDT